MNTYSVELYRRLQQTDVPPGWVEAGGIRLASSPERMQEIRRQISWARAFDLPLEEVSAAEAQQMFPLMDPAGVVGGAYLASDGWIDASMLCHSLVTLARRAGVTVATSHPGGGIDVDRGRVHRVRTDRGDVECEVVVNAGGIFAAEIGRLAGVRIPLLPLSHQYLVTDTLLPDRLGGRDHRADPLPTLRDPDLLVYFRQEGDGLVMGGYERTPEPFRTTATTFDSIPADFNGRLLPERLGPAGGDHRQQPAAGAGDGRRRHQDHGQRAGGLHPRQRVLPRRDRCRRASSSPPASAPTASPAPAGSAG